MRITPISQIVFTGKPEDSNKRHLNEKNSKATIYFSTDTSISKTNNQKY